MVALPHLRLHPRRYPASGFQHAGPLSGRPTHRGADRGLSHRRSDPAGTGSAPLPAAAGGGLAAGSGKFRLQRRAPSRRITSYNVCYTKLLRKDLEKALELDNEYDDAMDRSLEVV